MTTTFNFRLILKVQGALVLLESFFMALSAFVGWLYDESDFHQMLASTLICVAGGILLLASGWRADRRIGRRESYLMVATIWVVCSLFGMLPYLLTGAIPQVWDAFFETMSGFTTTGATILTDIESMSHSILFWRSITQWIGGLGIVMLSLAILPMFGFGSMQLYTAEATGPTYEKLRPRIRDTAAILWLMYMILTAVECVLLSVCGMDLFDAVCHSFTTMASGGFSTKNDSIAHYASPAIQYIIIVFMIFSGVNFSLLYHLVHGRISRVVYDDEARHYFKAILLLSLLVAVGLIGYGFYMSGEWHVEEDIRKSVFHVVALMTSTGFVTDNYLLWPGFSFAILTLLYFTGASAGSTSGGIKWVRIVIMIRNAKCELRRMLHPNAAIPVRLNGHVVSNAVVSNVFAFIVLYFALVVVGTLAFDMMGIPTEEAAGAAISGMGNIGPGFGASGPVGNFAHFPIAGKVLMSLYMLIGRLEIFTVMFLFVPAFWKR